MKFRYYITDLYEGVVAGTNDEDNARNFTSSDDYFVVDSDTGEWLTAEGKREPIKES